MSGVFDGFGWCLDEHVCVREGFAECVLAAIVVTNARSGNEHGIRPGNFASTLGRIINNTMHHTLRRAPPSIRRRRPRRRRQIIKRPNTLLFNGAWGARVRCQSLESPAACLECFNGYILCGTRNRTRDTRRARRNGQQRTEVKWPARANFRRWRDDCAWNFDRLLFACAVCCAVLCARVASSVHATTGALLSRRSGGAVLYVRLPPRPSPAASTLVMHFLLPVHIFRLQIARSCGATGSSCAARAHVCVYV